MAAVAEYHGRQFAAAFARGRVISDNFHTGINTHRHLNRKAKFVDREAHRPVK
jgi:hypothetical protein